MDSKGVHASIVGEGFDNERLTGLFLATPVKFSGRILQYMGRVLRPAPGKASAVIYDYVDINVDVLRSSAKGRKSVYRQSSCHIITHDVSGSEF
ncbi:MAG: hypothetical protein R6U50_16055 [Desulfobacterales bacterium]